jgi:hypothetical protein
MLRGMQSREQARLQTPDPFSAPPRPWMLRAHIDPPIPFSGPPRPQRFETEARCLSARQAKLDYHHHLITRQLPGQVVKHALPDGYTEPEVLTKQWRTYRWTCDLDRSESPS